MNILISLKYKNLNHTPDHLTNKNKEKDDFPVTMKIAPNNFLQNSTTVKKLINNPTTLENRLKQQKNIRPRDHFLNALLSISYSNTHKIFKHFFTILETFIIFLFDILESFLIILIIFCNIFLIFYTILELFLQLPKPLITSTGTSHITCLNDTNNFQ